MASDVHPSEGTLALLYAEIAHDLDGQHAYIDQLNQRAQQLFGFATAFLVGVPFFVLSAFYSGRAWEFVKWSDDPDVRNLWEKYRGKADEHVRHQVIQNRLASLKDNQEKLELKVMRIKRARLWLYGGFAYLVMLLVYRVISG
jgi:hypothetical protein